MGAATTERHPKRPLANRVMVVGTGLVLLGAAMLGLWGLLGSGPEPQLITGSTEAVVAESSSCVDQCQSHHDRCRVQTKGSPACDAERQRCLEQCLIRKRK